MDESPHIPDAVTAEIPDKLFFRMGEVSRIVGVEPYVLRYWETEFKILSPRKSSSGQRMYRRKDVELLLEIKHLLYERKFTIEGARKVLGDQKTKDDRNKDKVKNAGKIQQQEELFPSPQAGNPAALPRIRRELSEILALLS